MKISFFVKNKDNPALKEPVVDVVGNIFSDPTATSFGQISVTINDAGDDQYSGLLTAVVLDDTPVSNVQEYIEFISANLEDAYGIPPETVLVKLSTDD